MKLFLGKTILVTGGAHRIGRAIAEMAAEEGADVVVHYNSSCDAAREVSLLLRERGVKAWTVQGDLTLPDGGERLFDEVLSLTGGRLDAIVNCASEYERTSLSSLGDDDIVRAMRIHLTAPMQLIRSLAGMSGDDTKSVVNIIDARIGTIDREHEAYMLAKQSLANLTRNLAIELAPRVIVNAVAPGAVLEEQGRPESDLDLWAKANLLRRHGSPCGVAECVRFLLSSDFITGQTIFYDGGYHLRIKHNGFNSH